MIAGLNLTLSVIAGLNLTFSVIAGIEPDLFSDCWVEDSDTFSDYWLNLTFSVVAGLKTLTLSVIAGFNLTLSMIAGLKTPTLSVIAGLCWCLPNPPNYDTDNRIFNVRV